MNRKCFACILGIGLLSAQVCLFSAPLQKKVLIIGVDGTRPDALAVARTPNINALKANGAFSDRAVTDVITHSAAAWSSMFTGVWGDKHGVQDPGNSLAGNRFNLYPDFFKRLEGANSNLNTVAFARWAPLTNIAIGADLRQAFDSDAAITTAATNRLLTTNPDVMYMILLDVDSTGHSSGWGPTAPNYVKAIEAADARIGTVMGALTNRATYALEDWLVILLSDHGQHDGTIQETRITFHLVSGPSAARGTLYPTPATVDVCATVLTHMGIPIDPAWDLDARVEGLTLPGARYGTNLILNGDAESNSGTNGYSPNRGIAWWMDYTSMSLGWYGAYTNFPLASSPGPEMRGRNFFLGGTSPASAISQMLDLSALAGELDDPGVNYELSGWLGGVGIRSNKVTLTARFLDSTNGLLATNSIGPVTVTERGGVTSLVRCQATGKIPTCTRLVEFILASQATSGMNDSLADNLSFVLTALPDPGVTLVGYGLVDGVWRVEFESRTNRLYTLDSSPDLRTWTPLAPASGGTGGRLRILDTNPPPGQCFYRVTSSRP